MVLPSRLISWGNKRSKPGPVPKRDRGGWTVIVSDTDIGLADGSHAGDSSVARSIMMERNLDDKIRE